MSLDKHYQSPETALWQGRQDTPSDSAFFQLVKPLDLTKPLPTKRHATEFVLLGFSCDEGIRRNLGRTGASEGPNALRSVLAKFPIHRHDISIYDAGNITCTDGDLESAQLALGNAVQLLLSQNFTPILIGGGHEIAWGHYQGLAKQCSGKNLGIINFDTHFDMRPILENDKGSSGTPFLQIATAHEKANRRFDYNCIGIQKQGNIDALYHTAEKYQAKILHADEMFLNPQSFSHEFINRIINANDYLYLSLCLDVFSAAYAPGVSAPQSFGLSPWQVIPLFRQLALSGKVMSYDIAELSPKYDIDSRTVKLAANFVYEIIHYHQLAF